MDNYMEMFNRRASYNKIIKPGSFKETRKLIYDMIADNSTVLDYGCGNGSLGYLGEDTDRKRNVNVYGYDSDVNNKAAVYHDLREIGDKKFDYILLSHILEHCTLADVKSILAWCRSHCSGLIITLPNSGDNVFVNFYLDITHVRPYNNLDFLYVLESEGFSPRAVYRSQLEPGLALYSTLARLLLAIATQTSPFVHYTIVASVKAEIS